MHVISRRSRSLSLEPFLRSCPGLLVAALAQHCTVVVESLLLVGELVNATDDAPYPHQHEVWFATDCDRPHQTVAVGLARGYSV
jgi:hypothetical protein